MFSSSVLLHVHVVQTSSIYWRISLILSSFLSRVFTRNSFSFSLISKFGRLWTSKMFEELYSVQGDNSIYLLLLRSSIISLDQQSVFLLRYVLVVLACSPVSCDRLHKSKTSLGASHLFDLFKWNLLTSSFFFSTPLN